MRRRRSSISSNEQVGNGVNYLWRTSWSMLSYVYSCRIWGIKMHPR